MPAIGHHTGIHKYLMKKHNKKTFGFIKKMFIGLLRVGGSLAFKICISKKLTLSSQTSTRQYEL